MGVKKLLILGGISHMIDVVETAKGMGVYTIVCDYAPESPAKRIADVAYDVSTTDIDALYQIAIKERIDGVFAGFEDLNTWNALKLCQRLGLPFYASEEQLLLTSNKRNFKQFCRLMDVPVVPEFKLEKKEDIDMLAPEDFPLIVKPVDSYGSRGITIVNDSAELEDAYDKARSFSKTHSFIVEKFYSGAGVEFYYTVINGVPYLSAMTDRYVINQGLGVPPLPTATIYPAKDMNIIYDKYDSKIKDMIVKMGVKNGLLLFQAVRDADNIYIYEMAFRLTGEKHYQIVEREVGTDLLQFMIKLSLNEDVSSIKLRSYNKSCLPKPACNLAVLVGKGEVDTIKGLEEVRNFPEVVDYIQTIYEGDIVDRIGNYGQIIFRFNIIAETSPRLIEILEAIEEKIKVYSSKGEDMVINHFLRDEKKIFNEFTPYI